MKKNLYIGLVIVLVCIVNFVYAQNNHKTLHFDNKKRQTIETSSELQISEIYENAGEAKFVIHKEIQNQPSETKANYQFKLNFEGSCWALVMGNGENFYEMKYLSQSGNDPPYEAILPEGVYDITVGGTTSDNKPAFIVFEQILIDKNTELTADMANAIHKIDFKAVDAAGNSLHNMSLNDTEITFYLFMHPTIPASFTCPYGNWSGGFYPDIYLYVNDMGTRNKILRTAEGYATGTCTSYFITMPLIETGVTEDIFLENNSNDIIPFSQMYHTSKPITTNATFSNRGLFTVYYDFTGQHGWSLLSSWSYFRPHNKNMPYSLQTNLKFNDNPQTGEMNIFIFPLFYEFFDIYGNIDYTGIVAPFPMAINKDNELMIDFFSKFQDSQFNDPDSFIETMCKNPLSKVWNKDEFYDEGYRAPMLYHQALSSYGLINKLLFLGEYGEQKYNHGDLIAKITGDGVTVFNDSIYLLNKVNYIPATYSQYQIEVINDQVSAYGEKMVNRTTIDFDMTKSDVNPPTLTMLRVINNESISMFITDFTDAHLEIAAGDFTFNTKGMKYESKPNIEVFWSYDGVEYFELPVEEDVSKFHPSYGNFFNVNLEPTLSGCIVAWITVKIVLTDEAGNRQEQIFEPLFLSSGGVGIEDYFIEQQNSIAFPNPFKDIVTVELEKSISGDVYFEIYDISGKIIYQEKANCNNTNSFKWDGNHAKEGVYFYGIYSKNSTITGKIIKQ
jgi:hypothetical protein